MLRKSAVILLSSILLAGCGTATPDTPLEKRHSIGVAYRTALEGAAIYIRICKKKPPEDSCYSKIPAIQEAVKETDFAHEQMKAASGDAYVNLALAGLEVAIQKLNERVAGND